MPSSSRRCHRQRSSATASGTSKRLPSTLAAMSRRHVPLVDADQRLRQGEWAYWSGSPERVHDEMAGKTIGLLGFGHIGKAIATRAKAFEMAENVANHSPVSSSELVDQAFTLDQLPEFWARSTLSSSPCHSQRIPKPLSMRRHRSDASLSRRH